MEGKKEFGKEEKEHKRGNERTSEWRSEERRMK